MRKRIYRQHMVFLQDFLYVHVRLRCFANSSENVESCLVINDLEKMAAALF